MTVVVLGWDGLDPDRVHEFGLADAFGPQTTSVPTISNETLGKPHTYELWPSIITGCPPSVHGIHADEYIESGWNSRLLTLAARWSHVVPDGLRWRVGRLLRDHGAEYDFERPRYYRDQGLRTLFDDRHAVPLAVPNYRSQYDDLLDLSMDRGAALSAYLDVETASDGTTIHTPAVAPTELGLRLAAEAGEKLAAVTASLSEAPDLVFVWLGYLDTVGHVAPTLADPQRWYCEHYEHAAALTQGVRRQLAAGDELVCVSDHGLEAGRHTDRAFVGATTPVTGVQHILDVYDLVDEHAPHTSPDVGYATAGEAARAAVEDELEALGYI